MHVTDRRVSIAGGTVFTRHWRPDTARGSGPTIILFHDSLGSVALWRDFPQALAEATALPVLAYDRLGFGQSDRAPGPATAAFIADEARSALPILLDAFEITQFIGFGHSVGGAMAVHAAAAFPEPCLAVVTESAQAFVEDRTLEGIRAAAIQFADPAQKARLDRYHGDKTDWVLGAWIDTWLSPAMDGWTLDPALQAMCSPLLAIHGDRDEFGSHAHPKRIVSQAGGHSDIRLIDDCGHVPHREQPVKVLGAVTAFLNAL